MKTTYVVEIRDDLTAYPTFREDEEGGSGPISRTISSHTFATYEEAFEFYQMRKLVLRAAGSAGMYVTYPTLKEEKT